MGHRAIIAIFGIASGCGRVGFDPTRVALDDAGGERDGDIPACTFGPWSAPVIVAELNGPTDDNGPALSRDGLTIYFASDRNSGALDLYSARRPALDQPFGIPEKVPVSNDADGEANPAIADDDLTLYWGRQSRVFRATRASPAVPFETPISGTFGFSDPTISPGSLELFAVNTLDGDLAVSTRASFDSAFTTFATVAEVSSPSADGGPSISSDGLELYFHSNRSGRVDIWVARRQTRELAFGMPEAVSVNGTSSDRDPGISADGRELFFASDRGGGVGADEIWRVTRTCL